ncbi:hypothetical protein SDC9_211239 [bioreactor metagenome]|uniref:Uncharacterized protein n=1 Tax=bioreactor metagenome TaxID=1076179 RepID=A0A645JK28_9ZZZZ
MRQIGDSLYGALEAQAGDFIQKKSQQDGAYKAEHQVDGAHGYGVADALQELRAAKQPLEMLEANPGIFKQGNVGLIVHERGDPSPDGPIIEEKNIKKDGMRHVHKLPLPPKRLKKGTLPSWHGIELHLIHAVPSLLKG